MSYNYEKIKEWFNNPEVRDSLENKDFDSVFCSLDNYIHYDIERLHIASFIIHELKFPLLEQIDSMYRLFHYDDNIEKIIIPNNIEDIYLIAEWCDNLKEIIIEGTPNFIVGSLQSTGAIAYNPIFNCKSLEKIIFLQEQSFSKEQFLNFAVDNISKINLSIEGLY